MDNLKLLTKRQLEELRRYGLNYCLNIKCPYCPRMINLDDRLVCVNRNYMKLWCECGFLDNQPRFVCVIKIKEDNRIDCFSILSREGLINELKNVRLEANWCMSNDLYHSMILWGLLVFGERRGKVYINLK